MVEGQLRHRPVDGLGRGGDDEPWFDEVAPRHELVDEVVDVHPGALRHCFADGRVQAHPCAGAELRVQRLTDQRVLEVEDRGGGADLDGEPGRHRRGQPGVDVVRGQPRDHLEQAELAVPPHHRCDVEQPPGRGSAAGSVDG